MVFALETVYRHSRGSWKVKGFCCKVERGENFERRPRSIKCCGYPVKIAQRSKHTKWFVA
jgi:hypothetical protein